MSGPDKGKSKGKDKARGGARTEEEHNLVKEIMEEFIAHLGKGLVDTNIFFQPVSRRSGRVYQRARD
jgi:hypothetical protein